MKMGDGGFRPALNVQTATAGSELGGPRTVLAVQVTNVGSDMGAMTPMLEQTAARTGQVPETLLADANHAKHEAIVAAMAQGIDVVVPVPTRSSPSTARQNEEPEIQAWKDRRKTDDAKEPYRARHGVLRVDQRAVRRAVRLATVPRARPRQSNLRRAARGDHVEPDAAPRDARERIEPRPRVTSARSRHLPS
jgi:hypothetical protein